MLRIGSDFSGVGAFEQALIRCGVEDHKIIFACDMDKYARKTYIENYGEPEYFPENVYDRKIPALPLDFYISSPPCQSFSLAGNRKGTDDKRGILFFNSHEFIVKNKPKYFIFENVQGLLSDDKGRTFQNWIDMLGGKSVNGNPIIFPHEDSVPYHIYYKVMNSKDYNVPQSRDRVFIIGIRNDEDNNFHFPRPENLTKKIVDILEENVSDKFNLTPEKLKWITNHRKKRDKKAEFLLTDNDISHCITTRYPKMGAEDPYIQIKSATKKGYEIAKEGDSVNFTQLKSETRRGRVGKGIAQSLECRINQGVVIHNIHGGFNEDKPRMFENYSPTIRTAKGGGHIPSVMDGFTVRRFTPRECFRLMDFPDSFTWSCSDTQAYKQAGNSVVVKMYEILIKKLIK